VLCCVCWFYRKMFIGGLNWQTTPGTYYSKPVSLSESESESGSERETGRAKASEIFLVSERQYTRASRSERNLKRHMIFLRATVCDASRI